MKNGAGVPVKSDVDGDDRKTSRLRRTSTNVLLLIVSFTVAGLIAEGAVRLISPQQLILVRPDIWMAADTGWIQAQTETRTC